MVSGVFAFRDLTLFWQPVSPQRHKGTEVQAFGEVGRLWAAMRQSDALDDASLIEHSICMGRVVVQLKLTNSFELEMKRRKLLKGKPRSVKAEALVDTGATRLYLQSSLIKALGLPKQSEVHSKTTNGVRRRAVFAPVRLELMGRYGDFNVVEVDDDVPNLMGQIPLEYLDFVVDPRGQKLIPNPEHGDKQMSEEY